MQALNRADHHTDMRRHFAAVKNGDAAGCRHLHTPPVGVFLFVAGDEIRARFVPGYMVQFQSEYMPVIENHQSPAVHLLKTTGAVSPWLAVNKPDKVALCHTVISPG